jgi:hypothetical protein
MRVGHKLIGRRALLALSKVRENVDYIYSFIFGVFRLKNLI